MFDIKITGATIIDGENKPGFIGDIGITGDKITSIGDLSNLSAKEVIDAKGKVVCPGFIEIHSHSDMAVIYSRNASSRIYDGVTTDVIGNCGIGTAPICEEHKVDLITYLGTRLVGSIPVEIKLPWNSVDDYLKYLEAEPPAINIVPLLAQGVIRINEMGFAQGEPTKEQLLNMQKEVAKAMEAGCVGMSSGLIYMPGEYTSEHELTELCKAMKPYGGYYVTHMRSEGNNIWNAIDEAVNIAQNSGVPLHISHLKLLGYRSWGQTEKLFKRLEQAKNDGLELTYDAYPYTAGCTSIGTMLPPWAFEGGVEKLFARLRDNSERQRMTNDIINGLPGWEALYKSIGGWDNAVIGTVNTEDAKKYLGLSITQAAALAGKEPFDFVYDFILEQESRVQVIVKIISEDDLDTILGRPETMVCSDSMALATEGILASGRPHPRAFGARGKFIRRYVKELKKFTIEEAISKMTSKPAKRLGLHKRGLLKEGFYADIVIFDYEKIRDLATYENPLQYTTGIETVIVNGKFALKNNKEQPVYSGYILRHGGK